LPGAWQAEHAHAGPPQPDLPKLGREGSVYSHQIKTIDYRERGATFRGQGGRRRRDRRDGSRPRVHRSWFSRRTHSCRTETARP